MALTVVQRAENHGTGLTLSCSYNSSNAAGNLLVVYFNVATITAAITNITGNSNTYTPRFSFSGNGFTTFCYDVLSCTPGSNMVSVTVSANGGFADLVIYELNSTSGLWSFDQSAAASGTATTITSGNTATTSNANEALIGYIVSDAGATGGEAGWTVSNTWNLDQYQIVSAAGAYASTGTIAATGNWISAIGTWFASGVAAYQPSVVSTSWGVIGVFGSGAGNPY